MGVQFNFQKIVIGLSVILVLIGLGLMLIPVWVNLPLVDIWDNQLIGGLIFSLGVVLYIIENKITPLR